MMRAMLIAGALALAAAGVGTERAPERAARWTVVRAEVPFAIGEARGSAEYGGTVAGERWKVVMGWRAGRGGTEVGVGVVRERERP